MIATLRTAGCVFAEEEAQMLHSAATDETNLAVMIGQRVEGIPLEHIIGCAEFCDIRVKIKPKVFIPRFKTEFLVEQAIALCNKDSRVLDLCCGSGAIGLALISEFPSIQLFAADIDPIAINCAIENLSRFNVDVFQGDLFEPLPKNLKGKIDVIVANAPYVPTEAIDIMPREARLHESHVALDGGKDGLDIHRRVAQEAAEWLAPGGNLLVETGKTQAVNAARIFSNCGMDSRIVCSDDYDSTVVIGTNPASDS